MIPALIGKSKGRRGRHASFPKFVLQSFPGDPPVPASDFIEKTFASVTVCFPLYERQDRSRGTLLNYLRKSSRYSMNNLNRADDVYNLR